MKEFRMSNRPVVAVHAGLALLALCAAVAARAQTPDDTCRNGSFPANETAVGRSQVIGQGRVTLLDDTDGCPAETAKCRANTTTAAPGAVLVTGHHHGAFVCTLDPVSGNAGYVEGDRLKALPVDVAPALKAWVGHWRQGDDTISLTAKGTGLSVSGEAYWPSAHAANANEGDLSGTATPKGNVVVFADAGDPQGCSATLRLVGDVIVAVDNQNCGGMNVSFTGAYRRR
jgi:hypothetical protein